MPCLSRHNNWAGLQLRDWGTADRQTNATSLSANCHPFAAPWFKPMKAKVTATLHFDATDLFPGRHFASLSLGPERDIVVLSAEKPVRRSHGAIKSASTHHFRVHHWQDGRIQETDLAPSLLPFNFIQPVGDEGYLRVHGRCAENEPNAHLFDRQGQFVRSWSVGTAIADVQTAPNGKIWVSYIDEGALGGDELSRQGLTCFNSRGELKFGFNDARGDLGPIYDCYALNVVDKRETWLFYYAQFSIVQLRDKKVHRILPPTAEMIGSGAFAVSDSRLLFTGGYRNENQLFWRDAARDEQIELDVTFEGGKLYTGRSYLTRGRGPDLFFIDGPKVWILSLDEIGF
jgi:hypothetical protein